MAEREQPLLSGPNGAPNSYLVSPKKSCSFAYAQLVFRDCTDYVLTSGWRLRNRRSGISRPMKGERRKTLIVVSQRPVNGSIRLLCASTGLHVTGKKFLIFKPRRAVYAADDVSNAKPNIRRNQRKSIAVSRKRVADHTVQCQKVRSSTIQLSRLQRLQKYLASRRVPILSGGALDVALETRPSYKWHTEAQPILRPPTNC